MEFLVIMARERHQSLLKEAARERLIKQAKMYRKQNRPVKQGLMNRVMISVGELMVKTGYHIKNRFEPANYENIDFYQDFDKKECA